MNNYKPLKDVKYFDSWEQFIFDFDDIKSAIEGLKSAIIDKFSDRCSDDAGPILVLIDKWFSDTKDNDIKEMIK